MNKRKSGQISGILGKTMIGKISFTSNNRSVVKICKTSDKSMIGEVSQTSRNKKKGKSVKHRILGRLRKSENILTDKTTAISSI